MAVVCVGLPRADATRRWVASSRPDTPRCSHRELKRNNAKHPPPPFHPLSFTLDPLDPLNPLGAGACDDAAGCIPASALVGAWEALLLERPLVVVATCVSRDTRAGHTSGATLTHVTFVVDTNCIHTEMSRRTLDTFCDQSAHRVFFYFCLKQGV